jgi:hypothetical protein
MRVYVDGLNGHDQLNNGRSADSAYKTIGHAWRTLPVCGNVRTGRYSKVGTLVLAHGPHEIDEPILLNRNCRITGEVQPNGINNGRAWDMSGSFICPSPDFKGDALISYSDDFHANGWAHSYDLSNFGLLGTAIRGPDRNKRVSIGIRVRHPGMSCRITAVKWFEFGKNGIYIDQSAANLSLSQCSGNDVGGAHIFQKLVRSNNNNSVHIYDLQVDNGRHVVEIESESYGQTNGFHIVGMECESRIAGVTHHDPAFLLRCSGAGNFLHFTLRNATLWGQGRTIVQLEGLGCVYLGHGNTHGNYKKAFVCKEYQLSTQGRGRMPIVEHYPGGLAHYKNGKQSRSDELTPLVDPSPPIERDDRADDDDEE